ncbi:hypothetical protein Phou_020390 [Phytohabitans houttuyneae]|uniref:Uncharacterized protein n=1 Tax=Phytohabitans houttuyneae TaxID=1076126 RepID=A0A6V8K6W3_9ACTN|nr:hypothetical protein Phou_020390 [Phytohabitans houttuyneae]
MIQRDRHHRLRRDTRLDQAVAELVGPTIQLRIRQLDTAVADHRDRVRSRRHTTGEQLQHRPSRHRRTRLIPADQQPLTLSGLQHLDRVQRHVGGGGDGVEHAGEAPHERLDGLEVEQVRGGDERPAEPGRAPLAVEHLADGQVKIKLCRYRCPVPRGGRVGGVAHRAPGVLDGQHDLKQRVPGQRTGRREVLDEAFEGNVLVFEGTEAGLADPVEDLPKLGVAGQVGADHQRVDEEPDQVVHAFVSTAGDREADRDVRAGAEAGQRHREGGLQHHERGYALGPCQVGEALVHVGGHVQRYPMATVGGHRRPRAVVRQGQLFRHAGEGLPPVADLPGQHAVRVLLVAEQLALPQRVVRVLHLQRVPVRRGAVQPGRVRGRHVPPQRGHRPAVSRDVVHQQHQDVVVRRDLKQ